MSSTFCIFVIAGVRQIYRDAVTLDIHFETTKVCEIGRFEDKCFASAYRRIFNLGILTRAYYTGVIQQHRGPLTQ